MLPFTHEQFLSIFAAYNTAIWPAQVGAYLVGLGVCVLAYLKPRHGAAWIAAGLALLWMWTGGVYHGLFFSRINAAALVFGGFFAVQGVLLLIAGATQKLRFDPAQVPAWRVALGGLLVAYSALLYPLVGWAVGLSYPAAPVFGVTPCPLTLFTWGVLLMATRVPWWLVVIPCAWALVGGSAAFMLGVPQDWPLLASALLAFVRLRALGA